MFSIKKTKIGITFYFVKVKQKPLFCFNIPLLKIENIWKENIKILCAKCRQKHCDSFFLRFSCETFSCEIMKSRLNSIYQWNSYNRIFASTRNRFFSLLCRCCDFFLNQRYLISLDILFSNLAKMLQCNWNWKIPNDIWNSEILKINLNNFECELMSEILISGWTWADFSFFSSYLSFSACLNN